MNHDDVCYLVAESPKAHGVFDPPEETARMVFCTVKSVGQREFYTALDHKLYPTIIFVLQDPIEYQGEKIVLWTPHGSDTQQRYGVVRTYTAPDGFEIYCEEATVDARTAQDSP